MEDGRGFAVISAPPGRYSPPQLTAVYWLVGQLLGRPFAQNVQGTLLYDVRDTGQDVRYGARYSVTNADAIARLVLDGAAEAVIRPFGIERFDSRRAAAE